jgi:hypothetical protein
MGYQYFETFVVFALAFVVIDPAVRLYRRRIYFKLPTGRIVLYFNTLICRYNDDISVSVILSVFFGQCTRQKCW